MPMSCTIKTPLRILLVEDDPDTRDIVRRLLIRAGYEVLTAADAQAALDVAERNRFDVLLSDVGLPGMDGCALMGAMQRLYGRPGIALTGFVDEKQEGRCRAAGFSRFLAKPARLSDVLDAIDAVGRPRGGERGPS